MHWSSAHTKTAAAGLVSLIGAALLFRPVFAGRSLDSSAGDDQRRGNRQGLAAEAREPLEDLEHALDRPRENGAAAVDDDRALE